MTENPNKTPWWHLWMCSWCGDNSKNEETRKKLLQAAFIEIHRVGFQAASLQNILKDTGLTKGALYHHFPNKQALGYAVLNEIIREFLFSEWITPLRTQVNPIDALQQIVISAGNQMTMEDIQLGCPLNNLSQEMSPIDEVFREKIETIYSEWREAIEIALEKGKEKNLVSSDINSRQFTLVFVATLEGCLGMAKNSQSLKLLTDCGQGLIMMLESLRPTGDENKTDGQKGEKQ
jgi:AcrR family transcriptional regulator